MSDRENNLVTIPTGNAVCLCCNGSARRPALASEEQYKDIMSGYDKETDTMACRNCGGQTMYGKPLGYTTIDPETGLGCEHKYIGRDAGRCYTIYTCRKCGSHYDIDSGD